MSRYVLGYMDFNSKLVDNLAENAHWDNTKLPQKGTFQIIYGFDHAMGYFCQMFPVEEVAELEVERLCGYLQECLDFDSMFTKLSGVKLGSLLKKYNEEKYPNYEKSGHYYDLIASIKHMDNCFMDLPF